MTTETFTTAGTFTWTAPANVTQVFVECWGGGGGSTGGGNVLGAGGGGGEYAAESAYTVVPGNSYTYVVGIAGSGVNGSPGGNGGNSSFDGTGVVAHGGKGGTATGSSGTGGAGGTGSTNSIHFNGGHGGAVSFKDDGGGGGGGSGGSASAGNNGADATTSGPGAGGAAVTGGGPGANGASSGAGITPSIGPGGGAGGGNPSSGAFGFAGQVQLTYGTGATKTGTETGSFGSETGTVQILIVGSDTGSFAEAAPGFKIQVSDTGIFAESAPTINASLSDTDFFTSTAETGSVSILIVDSDTGSFNETSAQALTGVIDSDAGSFIETADITAFEAPPIIPLSHFYPTILKPVVSPIFYGVKHTSTVGVVRWTTFTTIASRLETDWKIVAQQITAQQVVRFDAYYRRHKILMGYRFGLPSVVVHPVDWRFSDNQVAWQDDVRRSSQHAALWDTRQEKITTKRVTWMTRISGSTFRRTRFNTLLRIYIPANATTRYYGIEQPVVHPIAADSALPTSVAIKWNIDTSIKVLAKVRFNALDARTKKIAVWWNTRDLAVVKQSGTTWMLRQKKSSTKATAFKVVFRWPLKKATYWHDNASVVKQSGVLFNDLLKVRTQNGSQWEAEQRVIKRKVTTFRVNVPRKTQRNTAFNVRFRYHVTEIPGTLKFNGRVPQSTVHPITFGVAFAPAKQSTWNFIFEVTTQKATVYKVQKRVSTFRAGNWNNIQRTNRQQQTVFNTIVARTKQAIIEWNVGLILDQDMRQTSMVREDFSY